MLLAAGSPDKLPVSTPPGWFSEWLEKRAARKLAAEEQKAAPKKTSSAETRQKDAARRAAKREKLVETGIDALERWLKDFVHLGLSSVPGLPAAFWEEQAARMVDCQLPGAARMIREMATLPGSRADWAEMLLLRLGKLYLLAEAYRKLDTLPAESQQDVRSLLGWTVNQEDLLASGSGIEDDWLVLAARVEEDEKTELRTQSAWLYGKNSARLALILNFAFRAQPLDADLISGVVLRGERVYYPGSVPLRAAFRSKEMIQTPVAPRGTGEISAFLNEYAAALGKNPWLEAFPVILDQMTVFQQEQSWLVCDPLGHALPLAPRFASCWELFALGGGHPLSVFGLWDGFVFSPLCAWNSERMIQL